MKGVIIDKNKYIPPDDLLKIRSKLSQEDKQIFDLLVETGYRVDDVLRVRNYQLRKNELKLRERKTGNLRTVPIKGDYKVSGGNLEYVFKSRRNRAGDKRKLHRTTFWRHFEAAVKATGLTGKGYTVHILRKVYAVELYKRTGDVLRVQKDLGHKNIATTCLYLVGALDALNHATN